MSTNLYQFKGQLAEMAETIGVDAGLVQKKVAYDLLADVQRRTPVDTGRARANWFITVGYPSSEVHLHPDAAKDSIPTPTPPDLDIDGTRDVFITNNLPYIEALEEGHSDQAPNGMVGLAIEAMEHRIASVIAAATSERPQRRGR